MIVIGTRGSKLALAQAHWVAGELAGRGLPHKIKILTTKGDVVQDRFDKMEGKGFFTRELEDALREGTIDLAVHSLKDLPTQSPNGLVVRAIPKREDPFDVLLSTSVLARKADGALDLAGLRVGTSSNRRVQGIRRHHPRARFLPIRGNVPTRISKLERGDVDVLVLARAGLNRLGLDTGSLHLYEAPPPLLVPAPGQGALALQTRDGFDQNLSFLHHELSARCVAAERQILQALEGGCQLPLGVLIRPCPHDPFQLDLFRGFLDPHRPPISFSLRGETPESLARQALLNVL